MSVFSGVAFRMTGRFYSDHFKMLPAEISEYLNNRLRNLFGDKASIKSVLPLRGGCVNEARMLSTGAGNFFLKFNAASHYPAMFRLEANGLTLLENASCIRVPRVYFSAETHRYAFLLLEYISSLSPVKKFWAVFGRQLAELHRKTSDSFGLDQNNYIGSLPQSNRKHSDWVEFITEERLGPMLKMAVNAGLLDLSDVRHMESMYKSLPGILPNERPSLLHGDLWSGNFLVDASGLPCVIDPAVYYGNREMDLAMTRLFGGFSETFYDAYTEYFPPEPGWKERIPVNQLYPLLVHVNLFGGGYTAQVRQIIRRF